MTEVLTGSQILCRVLLEQGVDLLFGYPGGAIMPFYHALPEYPACGTCWCGTSRRRRTRPTDTRG